MWRCGSMSWNVVCAVCCADFSLHNKQHTRHLRWRDIQINTEVLLKLFTIHGLTMCNLHFSYRPMNIQRPMRTYGIRRTVSDVRYQRLQNRCECFSNNFLCWLINRQSQRSDNRVAGLEVKACLLHLGQSWWRNTIFGTQQAVWKERLWSKFLKKIFWLSFLRPAEVCDCFALEFLFNLPNDTRMGQFCIYLLEKLYWCRPHFSSACWVLMFCITIEDHKRMWVIPCPPQCTVLQCAS